ncbi:sigma-70 family RNA polymerase sigma factor [bacterium]|nr:sigma-70 family RNA polymerase sigma factor [bacterium]
MRDSRAKRDSQRSALGGGSLLADEELIRRQREAPGSASARAAAAQLYARYQEQVYLWCFRRTRDHESALDLTQDVMLTAYRALDSFRGESRYSTWLFTLTRNRCARALRRPRLTRDPEIDPDGLGSAWPDAATVLEAREREESLLALLNDVLSPVERLAVWYRYVEGLPVEEITRRLNSSLATGARGVLQTARRKLRATLEAAPKGQRGGSA